MKQPAVFSIPPSAHFAQELARGLIARVGGDPLALSSAVIYLPTQRATRGFGDAFAHELGGAALLPQFRALGDSDEEELLFGAASEDLDLLPVMDRHRRQFLLARLIQQWKRARGDAPQSFAQSAAMAGSLAQVMDEAERQGADLTKLKDILPDDMAAHWEDVTGFLDILHTSWPRVLEAENKMTPEKRRIQTLTSQAARLEQAPPSGWVIAAGSTGSIPATAQLLAAIARLPKGAVVLPGLDQELDADSWNNLDPGHPQFGLHQLLNTIGAERQDVRNWHAAPVNAAREKLLRETLRPAPTTDAWQALVENGRAEIAEGLNGLALVQAADPSQEALAIALALREALETAGRTAALVTPDRNLARRVAAEMARWNIAIDDSAGRPLAHTAAGSFLCLLAEAVDAHFAPVPLLALLKHPFARRGQDGATFRARARELDRWCLRGPRPDPGLAGITNAIARAAQARVPPPAEGLQALAAWWSEIAALLTPLEMLFAQDDAALDVLLDTHVRAAEALACDESSSCILWANPDGEAAFALVAALGLASDNLDPIEPGSWPPLFRSLAMQTPVRAAFGRHPRLAILGPLEARLQRFDLTILGGLNEGTWPQAAGADPWFSRPMRKALGLELPERSIGLSAHDFAMFAAGPQVLLTRSLKSDGAPTIAARWLQRLQQLVLGLHPAPAGKKPDIEELLRPSTDYAGTAAQLMEVPQTERLKRPAPTPPVTARPRRLSVTEIETWLRDPYAIYARHVLKLRPLDALDEAIGPSERGTALHKALQEFIARYPGPLPDEAAAELAALAGQVFEDAGIPKAAQAVWGPRFREAAKGFIATELARHGAIEKSHLETFGRLTIAAPGGDFELRGIADRIDVMKNGAATIIDYKSGAVPTPAQVNQLLSPQLPLEAAMLAKGAFAAVGPRVAGELIYIGLASEAVARKPRYVEEPEARAAEAIDRLARRIAFFDQPGTPYYPRVMPLYVDSVGDYDHLARVREWSASDAEEP